MKKRLLTQHWAYRTAEQILSQKNTKLDSAPICISSGISLGAPPHIGHSREFFSAAIVSHSLNLLNQETRLIACADDLDPLKKTPKNYEKDLSQWVGVSLLNIPDLEGKHKNYPDSILFFLVEAFRKVGLFFEIIKTSSLYSKKCSTELIKKVAMSFPEINSIIQELTGKKDDYAGIFKVKCPKTGKINETRLLSLVDLDAKVSCRLCEGCEVPLTSDFGKLGWRVEWPYKWRMLKVDVEPVAQDHSVKGGSYDTASEITKSIFGGQAPYPIKYAWVVNKSQGKEMHSSSGNSFNFHEVVKIFPKELLWWLFISKNPNSQISFDLRDTLIETYNSLRRAIISPNKADAISLAMFETKFDIPKSVADYSFNELINIILGVCVPKKQFIPTEFDDTIKLWANHFLSTFDLSLQKVADVIGKETETGMSDVVRSRLHKSFASCSWDTKSILDVISKVAQDNSLEKPFLKRMMYMVLFNKPYGPPLGTFLQKIGKEKSLEYF